MFVLGDEHTLWCYKRSLADCPKQLALLISDKDSCISGVSHIDFTVIGNVHIAWIFHKFIAEFHNSLIC